MPIRFFFVWIVISMSEVSKKSGEVTLTEFTEDGKLVRKIRSFVRREGRLTKGQEHAMENNWPTMGIDFAKQMLDWKEVYNREAPVVLEIGFGMGASLVEMAKNAAW